jgi:hypothetical protein
MSAAGPSRGERETELDPRSPHRGERASTAHAIDQAERRLEIRRRRLARHLDEAETAARRLARPIPLIALGVFAVGGFVLARSQIAARPARPRARIVAARTGLLAGLVTALQIALRVAGNPWVRRGWDAYRRSRRPARR